MREDVNQCENAIMASCSDCLLTLNGAAGSGAWWRAARLLEKFLFQ